METDDDVLQRLSMCTIFSTASGRDAGYRVVAQCLGGAPSRTYYGVHRHQRSAADSSPQHRKIADRLRSAGFKEDSTWLGWKWLEVQAPRASVVFDGKSESIRTLLKDNGELAEAVAEKLWALLAEHRETLETLNGQVAERETAETG